MDRELSATKMQVYIEPAQVSAMAGIYGWQFTVEDLTVYVTLRHRRKPDATYLLRASFEDFPKRAPSYVFVDMESKQMTDATWPPNVRHGSSPTGICTPGTREFHEHYHKNDAQYRWSEDRYSFIDTLQRIHRMLEHGVDG